MTNISRRGFLGAILAVAAASAVPTAVLAAVEAADPFAVYREIIRRMDHIVENKARFEYQVSTDWGVVTEFNDEGHALVDDLFNYMLDNLTTPTNSDEEIAEVRLLFNNREVQQELRNVPPTLLDVGIVVAVVRELMAIQQIDLKPDHMKSWDRFATLYQNLIFRS